MSYEYGRLFTVGRSQYHYGAELDSFSSREAQVLDFGPTIGRGLPGNYGASRDENS